MSFLLDINICSAHLKQPSGLTHRFVQHSGRLYVPSLVSAELYAWAAMRDQSPRILTALEVFFSNEVIVLPFDDECAKEFGRLRGELHRKGITVSPVDLLIASVASTHDLTLVTNNVSDFDRIPGLVIMDWLKP